MKKEFSFYEFTGIIVPSVTFLFCLQLLYETISCKQIVIFMSIGESISFLIVAYAFGHVLQGIGNFYESVLWKKIYIWEIKSADYERKICEIALIFI